MLITPHDLIQKAREALDEGDQLTAIAYALLAIDTRLGNAIADASDPYRNR